MECEATKSQCHPHKFTTPETRATLGAEMAWMEKKSYVAVKLDAELSAVLFQSLGVGGNVY